MNIKSRLIIPLLALVAMHAPLAPAAAQVPPDLLPATQSAEGLAGSWAGAIKLPTGQELTFAVRFEREGEGWTGRMDIPMQGARDLPLEEISFVDGRVRFAIANVPGDPAFDGMLHKGDTVMGTFSQGGASMSFEMKRGELEAPNRPQEPKPPFPYASRDVTFDSLAEGVTLAGTLTIPEGEGPFPGVILVSGSGPQDRNEELFGHKPFLVLADRLTKAGVAVLRYDDRGVGASTGALSGSTTADLSQDAEAALRFLREQPEVRDDAVGIVGHSEGGLIAPLVAARSEEVSFIVLLAGPGVPGDQVLIRQIREGAEAEGMPVEAAKAVSDAVTTLVEAVKSGAEESEIRAALEAMLRIQMGAGPDAPVPAEAIDGMYRTFAGPWFRHFLSYDPAEALGKVNVPVLVLQGELDRQVNAQVNTEAIREALAHNDDVRIEILDGLNHLFQPATTGAGSEYARIETTMDERVPRIIAEWVKEQAAGE